MESDSVRVGTEAAGLAASDMGDSLKGRCPDSISKWLVGSEWRALSSEMRIIGIHPAVFLRVASKGLTGYEE
jgi:hypothetical protein